MSNPSSSAASTSRSVVDSELEIFLDLVPLRMRRELYKHEEVGALIEVVMDLGRKPLARFPSGDWVISEHPIKVDDLTHAISKVIFLKWIVLDRYCEWPYLFGLRKEVSEINLVDCSLIC